MKTIETIEQLDAVLAGSVGIKRECVAVIGYQGDKETVTLWDGECVAYVRDGMVTRDYPDDVAFELYRAGVVSLELWLAWTRAYDARIVRRQREQDEARLRTLAKQLGYDLVRP